MHAAPADFSLRGQALAIVFGDIAGRSECLGDQLLVSGRIGRPLMHACCRIDAHHARRPDADIAELASDAARFLHGGDEALALGGGAHRGAAPDWRPDGRHQRANSKAVAADLVRQPLDVVAARVDRGVGVGKK